MQISITVEAQEGLTWPLWQQFAEQVETLGYAGLFRSDHFPNDRASLELVVSLAYLADQTERIHFGSLVAPMSFRDPVMLARQAAAIDDLSGGRLVLGLGSGWAVGEHRTWGYTLGDIPTRAARFQEGVQLITSLFRKEGPLDFEGNFYQLEGARLLPRPQREGGPEILLGGNGMRQTLPLAARYADVWNGVHLTPPAFRQRSKLLGQLLMEVGRDPGAVRRSVMLDVYCGRTEAERARRLDFVGRNWIPEVRGQSFAQILARLDRIASPIIEAAGGTFCPIVGTPEEVLRQMRAYADAGVEELIIQWFDLEDFEGLQLYAEQILPHLPA